MAQQTIGIGSAVNDGTGDPLRTAFTKTNANFTELYTSVAGLQSSDADLTAIAALSGTSGFLKKTGTNSWALDTNTYLTAETYTGTVTSASIVSANGFAGTVATSTSTPAITLTTSITGVLKGNGTAISAATAGTDYIAPYGSTTANYVLAAPNGSAGTPTFRALVAADIPALNYLSTSLFGAAESANTTRFPHAISVASNTPTLIQQNEDGYIGFIGEAVANSANASLRAVGVYGVGYTQGGGSGEGVNGEAHVSSSADTASAIGVRGYSLDTHTGGLNIGLYANAANSTVANYALYLKNGDVYSFGAHSWLLNGNLTFSGAYTVTIPTLNLGTVLAGQYGGTGVANTGKTITLGGSFTHTGAHTLGLTTSANTSVTLPTTGTLATLAGTETFTNKTLTSPTLTAPVLGTPASGNFSSGTFTWPTFNQNTSGTAAGLSATLVATSGGTGQSSYSVGDILYASTTTALSKLTAGTSGYVLTSGGAGVAPSWAAVSSGSVSVGSITGLGTGVATFLGTPSSANLVAALTDETGTGALLFGTGPTMTLPIVNNIKQGYSTTATAAGTTSLSVNSNRVQFFTGTTTQTLQLPAPQTMTLGMEFLLVNNSTGNVSVIASNSASVATVLPGTVISCISIDTTAGNGAAGWNVETVGFTSVTGTGSVVLSASPTFTGTVTGTAATATASSTASSLGYLGIPQSGTATTATLAIGDAGKHIYVTTNGQTITIPANASVAYPIGTTIGFIAGPSATTVTIAITSDTMYLAGTGTTGSRTLAAHGMATAVKVAATTWYISGNGLT